MNSTKHDGIGALVVAVADATVSLAKWTAKRWVITPVKRRLAKPLYKGKNPSGVQRRSSIRMP